LETGVSVKKTLVSILIVQGGKSSIFAMKPKRPKRYKKDQLDASAITPEIVAEWWKPRFGSSNPERMNNPLWEWLIRTRIDAYAAADRFNYPETSPWDDDFLGPAWCFARMGQSVTPLPDGRIVLISGEHEDGYDPDFKIYNDVTVYHPNGSLEIFSYPQEIFPPTDFHTATLIDGRIVVIGNLGYPQDRKKGMTQVVELDISTWRMRLIATSGDSPGWLHGQVAELSGDGRNIVVRGGLIDPVNRDETCPLLENPDQWSLNLENWQWTRITHHTWERYAFGEEGLRSLPLWKLSSLPFSMKYYPDSKPEPDQPGPRQLVPPEKWEEFLSRFGETNAKAQAEAADLYARGFNPDLEIFQSLYQPDVPHQQVPEVDTDEKEDEHEEYDEDGPFDSDEEDYSTPGDVFSGTRILINGVVVRYKEAGSKVVLTIEGKLPEEIVSALVADLQRKLGILLSLPIECQRL
jgi:hypothetical protein